MGLGPTRIRVGGECHKSEKECGMRIFLSKKTTVITWLVILGMTKEVGKSMDDINKQAGKRIRELRISKGISQEGLADSSGLHRSHMGEIERGELNVTLKTLERVSFALKVPVVDFLKGTGRRGGRL